MLLAMPVHEPRELPVHEVRDSQALRALAHPLRIRLLEELAISGSLTATEAAALVSESPANCSWHLRQLARYGFVEEAEAGPGRRRRWRLLPQQNRWPDWDEDEQVRLAGTAATLALLAREHDALRAWLASAGTAPAGWRDAGFITQSIGWLTAEELNQVGHEINEVFLRYADRLSNPARRPPGAKPVRLIGWGIPARPPQQEGN